MDAAGLDALKITLNPLSQAGLALALFTIMFSVALGLKTSDFVAMMEKPRVYLGGVATQVIGLPLFTLALIFAIEPPPSIALGMIVVAACPGGNVSNLMTVAGRGDAALSVAMTATSSIIAAVFTPAAILMWSSLYPPTASLLRSIEFDAPAFLMQTTALLAVPLTLGMGAARYFPSIAARIRRPGAIFGGGLLGVIVVAGTIDILPQLINALWLITPPVVIHSAGAFALGASAATLLRAEKPAARALTFEIGLQNSGLALVILLSQLQGLGGAAAVAAAWGVWHLVGGGIMVAYYRRQDAETEPGVIPMTFDLKITGGQLFDGSGGQSERANIGVKDGRIAEIGACAAEASRTIDAEGAIVTPGFIDLHTHYDGQVSWDEELRPSVNFGVTTAVMGNCGVGFAPVRAHDHDRLIKLMEGVEDIPGTALHEGLTWNWESFGEYLSAIDAIPHTIDFAVMAVHDPLRVYVMGERASAHEQATDDDLRAMQGLLKEALDAGAAGFSIGRTDIHRTADGDWTPSSEAAAEELVALSSTLKGRDKGVLQVVNDFNLERPGDQFDEEFAVIEAFAKAGGRPTSISLMQRDMAPDQWTRILQGAERLNAEGLDFRVQVAPRAIGVFQGLQCTFHPMMAQPSYIEIKDKPLAERVAIMRDPTFKARCLSETPVKLAGEGSSVPPIADTMIAAIELVANKFFRLGETPDYDQGQDASLGAEARRDGVPAMEKLYDTLLELDGKQLIYFPIYNYTEFNYDNVRTMLTHPKALLGLSDGGAHVGTICDASFPAYLLSYWTRDRAADRIDVSRAIQMLTADGADYLGLTDRGRLREGMRADINVIDYDNLSIGAPRMVQDLPAGGQRLLQPAKGFRATLVAGRQVVDHDQVTQERPGRLVRFH